MAAHARFGIIIELSRCFLRKFIDYSNVKSHLLSEFLLMMLCVLSLTHDVEHTIQLNAAPLSSTEQ